MKMSENVLWWCALMKGKPEIASPLIVQRCPCHAWMSLYGFVLWMHRFLFTLFTAGPIYQKFIYYIFLCDSKSPSAGCLRNSDWSLTSDFSIEFFFRFLDLKIHVIQLTRQRKRKIKKKRNCCEAWLRNYWSSVTHHNHFTKIKLWERDIEKLSITFCHPWLFLAELI